MKKTILISGSPSRKAGKPTLIIISIILSISFILSFIYFYFDDSAHQNAKDEAIKQYKEKLDENTNSIAFLEKQVKELSAKIKESAESNEIDLLESKLAEAKKQLKAVTTETYPKAEFYDNDQIKYKRIVGESGRVTELHYFYDGKIHKEKISINSDPYEEVVYYKNGNRKQYFMYEEDNIVNIITNYQNGQIESQGKKIQFNGKNDIFHGTWIWYNEDGTIREERKFN